MKQVRHAIAVLAVIIGVSFVLYSPLEVMAASQIRLTINGQAISNMPTPPIIQQGSTLVPARAVFQAGLGAVVEWDEVTRTVSIQHGDRQIFLVIGSRAIIINGQLMEMPIPAQIINGNTMIPLRAVAENLGFEVDFRDRTVFIDNPDSTAANPTPAPTPPPPPNSTNPPRNVSTAAIPSMPFPVTNIMSVTASPKYGPQAFAISASSAIPAVESFLLYGNRLVIDFPNSRTELNGPVGIPYYSPALDVRASQFCADSSRVVLVLPDGMEFSIRISDDRLHVFVMLYTSGNSDTGTNGDSNVNNGTNTNNNTNTNNDTNTNSNTPPPVTAGINPRIRYESGTIRIPKGAGFSMNQAAHNNRYRQNQYILTLPVDASGHLGIGNLSVSGNLLQSLTIGRNQQGHSYITLTGRQIFSVAITETDAYYHIRVMRPQERYQRIVIIDPGHGGQPGAVYNDVRAANLNLAIARKVTQLINECGYMAVFTTRSEDIFVSLSDRAQFANSIGDIMVTIHHNAWYDTSTRGVESYYLLNDFDTRRSLTSQNFAAIMQRQLVAHTGRIDREHKSANYMILRQSEIPSVLIEVGFMSNPQEFATLISADYQWRVARAIYDSLREAFLIYTPSR